MRQLLSSSELMMFYSKFIQLSLLLVAGSIVGFFWFFEHAAKNTLAWWIKSKSRKLESPEKLYFFLDCALEFKL